MKELLSNTKFLQWAAGILLAIASYFGVQVWNYSGRINVLNLENIRQDSTIVFQKIKIESLESTNDSYEHMQKQWKWKIEEALVRAKLIKYESGVIEIPDEN